MRSLEVFNTKSFHPKGLARLGGGLELRGRQGKPEEEKRGRNVGKRGGGVAPRIKPRATGARMVRKGVGFKHTATK